MTEDKIVLYLCDYCEDLCLKSSPEGCIGYPYKFRKVLVTISEMEDIPE